MASPSEVLARAVSIESAAKTGENSAEPRVYTIWPATPEDLPANTSGPWPHERSWLVLDVTDGIAASYVVEGPVEYSEALHRASEIHSVAASKLKQSVGPL